MQAEQTNLHVGVRDVVNVRCHPITQYPRKNERIERMIYRINLLKEALSQRGSPDIIDVAGAYTPVGRINERPDSGSSGVLWRKRGLPWTGEKGKCEDVRLHGIPE